MNIKKLLVSIMIVLILFMIYDTSKQENSLEESNKENDEISEDINQKKEDKEDPVDEIRLKVDKMTLEEKIGQLVLVGMEGYEANDNIIELIQNYYVGGIILYGKNISNSNQLLSLINSLKDNNSLNKTPLFISVDEEGGSVSRNPNEIKTLPTAKSIGKTEDKSLAFESGRLLGQTVKAFGYNMNFAPVLDIDSNPLNPVIRSRSFGSTAEIVSTMGLEVIKGISEENVIPVIKHFPGHGDTSVDSHIGLPVVDYDMERIRNFEMKPFKDAINNGADVVMVAHILMSQIDSEYPSSMSSILIDTILRDQLQFNGVVITDDMTMGAIMENYDIGTAAIKSLNAGADIILVGHDHENALNVLYAIKNAVNSATISIDRIDESVYRIIKLKDKYGLEDSVIEGLNIQGINDNIQKYLDKL